MKSIYSGNLLIAIAFIFTISSCCTIKNVSNDSYFYGTIEIYADAENNVGIVALPIDGEDRKQLIYLMDGKQIFSKGDTVKFKIGHLKGIDIATDVQRSKEFAKIPYPREFAIESHYRANHPKHGAHKIRHILNGNWVSQNQRGSNGKYYNIAEFDVKTDDTSHPQETFAVPITFTLNQFIQGGTPLELYFNINPVKVTIDRVEYAIIDDISTTHSNLPH